MSLSIEIDPQASDLFTAIGLADGDGQVDTSWFDDPLARAQSILSDPVQRAALLRLLEDLLSTDPDMPGPVPAAGLRVRQRLHHGRGRRRRRRGGDPRNARPRRDHPPAPSGEHPAATG